MATNKKSINVAFQGGGAHGAISWGVADRLLEDERIHISAISGTSAGAVNAAALAYGMHKGGNEGAREELRDIWKSISDAGSIYSPVRGTPMMGKFGLDQLSQNDLVNTMSYQMFDTLTRTLSPYQFNPFDINPLRDVISKSIDFRVLRQCQKVALFISATNVNTGKVRVFNTGEVTEDVVCASACLPFLFKAVEIDGASYWDGGYMGNPVLYPFFYREDNTDIVIVHVNPIEREEVPTTAPDILNRVNEISFNSSLMRELRSISFVHKLLDDGWIKDEYRDQLRNIRIHSVRSDEEMKNYSISSKFRVDWPFLEELRDKGYAIADEWLAKNFDHLGNTSSIDLRAMFDA